MSPTDTSNSLDVGEILDGVFYGSLGVAFVVVAVATDCFGIAADDAFLFPAAVAAFERAVANFAPALS